MLAFYSRKTSITCRHAVQRQLISNVNSRFIHGFTFSIAVFGLEEMNLEFQMGRNYNFIFM